MLKTLIMRNLAMYAFLRNYREAATCGRKVRRLGVHLVYNECLNPIQRKLKIVLFCCRRGTVTKRLLLIFPSSLILSLDKTQNAS